MENKASITSLMSSFVRAYHSENSETPIFSDTVAKRLISEEEYESIRKYILSGADFFVPGILNSNKNEDEILKEIIETQLLPTPAARSRFCEDSLKTAVMTGTKQYVLLGAGMDTFAWRSDFAKKLEIFEADHPETQEDKKKRLAAAKLEIPKNLHFAPIDFSKDNIAEKLISCGFDVKKKTFFSLLGVSYYLTQDELDRLLCQLSYIAAEGSTLVFDYADSGLFKSKIKRVQNMLAMAQAAGEPMRFCSDISELTALLEKNHFLIYEHMTPESITRTYFYETRAFEHISYVTAVIKGTHGRSTKENILTEALRLFSEKGYESVSVRDISGRLGITQAALYKHYKSKRDIFDSIFKKMEDEDKRRAGEFNMPQEIYEKESEKYKNIKPEELEKYTLAQFHYWTCDSFAAHFRKMLTIEQYNSRENAALYQQCFSDGVINYLTDIFRESNDENPRITALRFYGPLYMLINIYDFSDNKEKIFKEAEKHIKQFTKGILK